MGALTVRVPCAMKALQVELHNCFQTQNVVILEWMPVGRPAEACFLLTDSNWLLQCFVCTQQRCPMHFLTKSASKLNESD